MGINSIQSHLILKFCAFINQIYHLICPEKIMYAQNVIQLSIKIMRESFNSILGIYVQYTGKILIVDDICYWVKFELFVL